jgi:ornithine--oxo-acid transaminase
MMIKEAVKKYTSRDIISLDQTYSACNYEPLPVVIDHAEGVLVRDPEGRVYYDFLSAYSAVNQGHRHPKIIAALREQAEHCTLTSRAFHNSKMGLFLRRLCEYSGYEMALPMNTGVEAVETALKLARRWGVEQKGIKNGCQEIIIAAGNFHGRTLTVISFSTDPLAHDNFGPYTPGFKIVPYNDPKAIENEISENTCAILLEPIQGEAGIKIPDPGYLSSVRKICDRHRILFIADEIQTGFCRTGRKFALDYENVRADIMTLGKALGGGVLPVSAVVASRELMSVFTPGSHGSTFGGNPLASAVGLAALDVLDEDNLAENATVMGELFRQKLAAVQCPKVVEVRGKGLLNAVEFEQGFDAHAVCLSLMDKGVLAKQTHGHIIRFAPPLVIRRAEMEEALSAITGVISSIG